MKLPALNNLYGQRHSSVVLVCHERLSSRSPRSVATSVPEMDWQDKGSLAKLFKSRNARMSRKPLSARRGQVTAPIPLQSNMSFQMFVVDLFPRAEAEGLPGFIYRDC